MTGGSLTLLVHRLAGCNTETAPENGRFLPFALPRTLCVILGMTQHHTTKMNAEGYTDVIFFVWYNNQHREVLILNESSQERFVPITFQYKDPQYDTSLTHLAALKEFVPNKNFR